MSAHRVYPDGPFCDPNCPGDWSTWHDGFAAGYETAEQVGYRAGRLAAIKEVAEEVDVRLSVADRAVLNDQLRDRARGEQ